jgi:hypothetical protein
MSTKEATTTTIISVSVSVSIKWTTSEDEGARTRGCFS